MFFISTEAAFHPLTAPSRCSPSRQLIPSLYASLDPSLPFAAAGNSSHLLQLWPDEWFLKSSTPLRALQTLSAPTSIASNKSWTALTCSSNPSIVLVHGIDGDPIKTWTNAESSAFWPQDWLPAKFPHARVFSFGYNADMYRNNSVAGIRDNARSLLSFLELERESLDSTPPIVFIAHCLGGLIVKQVSSSSPARRQCTPSQRLTWELARPLLEQALYFAEYDPDYEDAAIHINTFLVVSLHIGPQHD